MENEIIAEVVETSQQEIDSVDTAENVSDKEFKLTITITTKFQQAITNSLETDEKIENLGKEIKAMEKN